MALVPVNLSSGVNSSSSSISSSSSPAPSSSSPTTNALANFVFAAPANKKRRGPPPKVLEEDAYTSVLEHIVERDFFPDLKKLKSAAAKAESSSSSSSASTGAVLSGIPATNAATERYSSSFDDTAATPNIALLQERHASLLTARGLRSSRQGASSSSSSPPTTTEEVPLDEVEGGLKVPANMTIEQFLNAYTSEDMDSFSKIMEDDHRKHREKHAWAYVQEFKSMQHTLRLTSNVESQLALTHQAPPSSSSSTALTVVNPASTTIATAPPSSSSSSTPSSSSESKSKSPPRSNYSLVQPDDRSAAPETWPYRALNSLMYVPDGVAPDAAHLPTASSSSFEASSSSSPSAGGTLSKYDPKRLARPKEIVYANTRFAKPAPKAGISLRASTPAHPTSAGLVAAAGVIGKAIGPNGTPMINGYSIPSTPMIQPGMSASGGGSVDPSASPMMTWGEVMGTPQHIVAEDPVETMMMQDQRAGNGLSFKMPDTSARDALAHRLGNQASQARQQHRSQLHTALARATTPLLAAAQMAAAAERQRQTKAGSGTGSKASTSSATSASVLRASSSTPSPMLISVMRSAGITPSSSSASSSSSLSSTTPSRLAQMSPAARQLLAQQNRAQGGKGDMQLRSTYGLTPSIATASDIRSHSTTPKITSTPTPSSSARSSSSRSVSSSLTDNLL